MTKPPKQPAGKRAALSRRPHPRSRSVARRTAGTVDDIVRLHGEPWVGLATGRDLAGWTKNDEIRYNQGNRQAEKYLFFRRVFDFLNENEIRGDYHEYGCHRCRTFRMALTEARRHNLDGMRFWAFDSFEGLPRPTAEVSVSSWAQGALTTSEAEFREMVRVHGIYLDMIATVKGFYSDSLTPELQQRMLKREQKIALVTIDCDLYQSAIPVFDFIDPMLQEGAVVYLDDLFVGNKGNPNRGVAQAFLEYQKRTKWRFSRHLDVGWWGRSYVVRSPDSAIDGVI
jgi:hypothetical protein